MISILPLPKARRHKRRYDAVISVEDPGIRAVKRLRFHRKPHPDHLVLRFEDIDHLDEGLAGPDISHMAAAISFGRLHTGSSLLVHCHAGVCRSTAIGLAIIADRLGPGAEAEAVRALLASNPGAAPTLCMLEMADALLDRSGALVEAWNVSAEQTARLVNYRNDKAKLLSEARHLFFPAPHGGHFPAIRYAPDSLEPSNSGWIDPELAEVTSCGQRQAGRRSRNP
jgi:predicted protein tyrosine phosphatase|nr:hypothetical protein [Neorhizobium tomejilense]